MTEPISVAAIVISAVTALGGVLTALHIKRLHSGCCECDCSPGSPLARSPTVSKANLVLQPIKILDEINGQKSSKSSTDSES
jgi:hypothetical protein